MTEDYSVYLPLRILFQSLIETVLSQVLQAAVDPARYQFSIKRVQVTEEKECYTISPAQQPKSYLAWYNNGSIYLTSNSQERNILFSRFNQGSWNCFNLIQIARFVRPKEFCSKKLVVRYVNIKSIKMIQINSDSDLLEYVLLLKIHVQ